jgi:hypothetical protein
LLPIEARLSLASVEKVSPKKRNARDKIKLALEAAPWMRLWIWRRCSEEMAQASNASNRVQVYEFATLNFTLEIPFFPM